MAGDGRRPEFNQEISAYRLRAIGHLHEAEDESQAWPELHQAIRAARRAYQQRRTMPEFAALAQQIATYHGPAPAPV